MNTKRVSSVDWEKDIYAKGKQVNRWPYTEVVSKVIRETGTTERKKLKVLETGCGAGNNIWFLAAEGYEAYGIDYSSSAIDYAAKRLKEEGLQAELEVGDISNLPWPDDYFDIVIDRGAITQNNYEQVKLILAENFRVLKPGGVIMCFTLFSINSPDRVHGREVSYNTYDHFTAGCFKNVGLTSFFTRNDLEQLFHQFKDLEIIRESAFGDDEILISEYYTVCGRKS